MEHGAQNWLDEVIGTLPHALTPDTPLRMASEEMRSPISSMRCSSGQAERSSRRRALQTMWRDCPRPCAAAIFSLRIRTRTRSRCWRSPERFSKRRSSAARSISPAARTGGSAFRTFSSGRRWSIIITTTMPASRMCTISPGPWAKRVTSMRVNGQDVREEDTFTICLNSYRASGTGGYDFLYRLPCRARDRHGDGGSDLGLFQRI